MEKNIEKQQFEVIETANDYIKKLINAINISLNYIEETKYTEASELILGIFEGIEWLDEVARLTKDIQKENMDEEIMKCNLKRLEEYFNNQDFQNISNELKININPLLHKWNCIMEDI